jgi:hypothetical protein
VKLTFAEAASVPVELTVTGVLTVRAVTTVLPCSNRADATLPLPGVKPVPVIPTVPTPEMPCAAAKVMAGAPKTVSVADATLPAASTTVTLYEPGAVVLAITVPMPVGRLPTVLVDGVVVSTVAGVTAVLYQLAAALLINSESDDDAANPAPVTEVVPPGFTAVAVSEIVEDTVNVAVAEAVPAVTVIVCDPATVWVLGMLSQSRSIPPLVLVLVRPTPPKYPGKLPLIPVNVAVIGWFIGKFEPVRVSIVPAAVAITPLVGVIVIEDTVVVMLAVAVLKYASVAEIMWVPGRKTGTTNVTTIAPLANATTVVGTVMLSMVKDGKLWTRLFAKPEPTSVTVVPTAAFAGVTLVIAGAPVFVKVADALLIPVAVTVCGPDPDGGTVNIPTVVGGVGQVFAAHCVAPATAAPSKFMTVVVAGVVRNPVSITVVP